ncbi:WD40 repeat domain-containing protein [Limnoglobus roseus]|uniref:WD40 repeat domain-containing protein n=1 Tax=Limnoglobus roseus TaxID=2598579 RepID=A0A5C1A6Y1_9BACT|nr:hypothetical protein [Limnoglobus roseus]QEL13756.1 WD40 repeat domain-containing protein [Limnoglobus roseus]
MRTLVLLLLFTGTLSAAEPLAPVVAKYATSEFAPVVAVRWVPATRQVVVLNEDGTVRVWGEGNDVPLATMPAPPSTSVPAFGLTVSRDGRTVVTTERSRLQIWDRTKDTVATVATEKASPALKDVGPVEFAPDGRGLYALGHQAHFVTLGPDGTGAKVGGQMPPAFGKGERALIRDQPLVSLAGGLGVAYYEGYEVDEVRVWDFAKNDVAAKMELREGVRPHPFALTPDGQSVVLVDQRRNPIPALEVYESRSLTQVRTVPLRHIVWTDARRTFSPDGRLFAVEIDPKLDCSTYLICAAARYEPLAILRHDKPDRLLPNEYQPPRDGKPSRKTVSLSPDGRRAATAFDARVHVHNLQAAIDPTPPKAFDAAACWADLVSADGPTAMRAVYRLADHPAEAVKLFQEKVKPTAKPAAGDVAKWVKALDAPAFAERQTATKKLTAAADTVEPELKQEAANNASPEVVQAINTMLDAVAKSRRKLDGEYLRAYRIVQTLEMIGQPAAELLKAYAAGAKGAFLTQEAEAAKSRTP